MNRGSTRTQQDELRLQERAAEWLTVLESAGPDERAEFMDWIVRSPRHLEEFLLASAVAQETARLDLEQLPVVRERLAAAPASVAQLPVSEHKQTTASDIVARPGLPPARSRRRLWAGALLATSVLAAAAAAVFWMPERGEQRLEFRSETLAGIAAQFNRYNTSPKLVVIGEDIQARQYSGMFDADDPASLIQYLSHDPELTVEKRGGEWIIGKR